jgi:Txe/YoeB family toxin of toxin-antitoxin system
MVTWELLFTKQADKDSTKLKKSNLDKKAKELLSLIERNPYEKPPKVEKLIHDLKGFFSRNINQQHRIVYEIKPDSKQVKVLMMWGHYGE